LGGLTLTPGIRYDHYRADMLGDEDQTFTEFSKAFGAEYRFESGLGLFANYTELFRAPDTTESIRVNSGKFNQKNQLEPETGENKEVGIFFDHRGLIVQEDTFSLVGKYFRTHYDNLIVQTAGSRCI
jgi:hemoglobin/transferrin/lactoferrin receptor protein